MATLVLSSTLAILGVRSARPWPQVERSSAGLQVEDWFCVDDLVSALEGELEAAEVSEGAPAAAYGRPIEQLEAIPVRGRARPGHGGSAPAGPGGRGCGDGAAGSRHGRLARRRSRTG